MKCIILAAGQGTRIKNITKKKPKCLIKINKISILQRQIKFIKKLKIKNIIVIKGYKKNQINFKKIKYIINKNYKKNEQLESLFCAKKELNQDLLITFGDTIYDFSIIKKLFKSKKGDITLGIDKDWKSRYKFRFDHPYDQADKVYVNHRGKVTKIGKTLSVDKCNGEFLGILKLTKEGCKTFIDVYKKIKQKQNTKKMQVHDFIRILINKNKHICSCYPKGKFMEIDTFNDYKIAKDLFKI